MITGQVNTPDVLGKQRWSQRHRGFVLHAKYNESNSIYILCTLLQYIILKLILTGYDDGRKNETITKMGFFLFDLFCVVSLSPRCNFSLIDWLRAQKRSLIQSRKRAASLVLFCRWTKCRWCTVPNLHTRSLPCLSRAPEVQIWGRERRAEVGRASSNKHGGDVSVRDVAVNANTPPNIRLFKT